MSITRQFLRTNLYIVAANRVDGCNLSATHCPKSDNNLINLISVVSDRPDAPQIPPPRSVGWTDHSARRVGPNGLAHFCQSRDQPNPLRSRAKSRRCRPSLFLFFHLGNGGGSGRKLGMNFVPGGGAAPLEPHCNSARDGG